MIFRNNIVYPTISKDHISPEININDLSVKKLIAIKNINPNLRMGA